MNLNRLLGDRGEARAAKYLKKHKYKIICRNYSCKLGEIDIIARNKEYIIFVEVKTRTTGQLFDASESVDYKKQQRLIKTAVYYLKTHKADKQPRFDVAEVYVDSKGKVKINYIENAFWQESRDYAVF